jgi:hypothetical protein
MSSRSLVATDVSPTKFSALAARALTVSLREADVLREDLQTFRDETQTGIEAQRGRLDSIEQRLDTLDQRLIDHGHLLAEILRRLPAEPD